MSLLGEFRKRGMFRVAGVYAVAGWFVAQAAALAEDALGLPAWFDGAVVTVLLLGFPVLMAVSWAFEVTPDGLRRAAAPPADAPAGRLARIDIAILAAVVALVGVSAAQMATRARPAAPAASAADAAPSPESSAPAAAQAAADPDGRRSIAVLPFVNMSSDPEQEYFSDGLSEQLLNELAQIEDLRVTARTSSFAFKDRNADIREIGRLLGVRYVLEGSVRRSGGTLRITAQLNEAESGSHLWSETYDREPSDVFAIQDEIAMAVAQRLSASLGVGGRADGGTRNIDAYDAYLRARALATRANSVAGSAEDMLAAIVLLQRAVALDPGFAAAWAEMATDHGRMATAAPTPEERAQRLAAMEDAARRAVEAAPGAWPGQAALGEASMARRRWSDAQAAFDRAVALAGAPETVGRPYWNFLLQTGRLRDAVATIDAMLVVDPLAEDAASARINILYVLGLAPDPDSARASPSTDLRMTKALADGGIDGLAAARVAEGLTVSDLDRAIYEAPEQDRIAALRTGLAQIDSPNRIAYWAGAIMAEQLGDADLAVDWLRRGYVGIDSPNAYWFLFVPALRETRRTEGFKRLVRDLGLVDHWRETDEWGDFCRPLGADDFECA